MDCLINIGGKIAEYAVVPVARQLGYLCFMSSNIQNLKQHVEKLKETRELVQQKISNAKQNAQDMISSVINWLSEVDDIIEKCETIFNEGQQLRLCSNLIQRYKLSRKTVKMVEKVLEIKDKENFEQVSYNASLSEYESTIIRESEFLYFESRKLVMEQIMDAVLDNNSNRIGVHGMGGAGKTMLVDEISRKVMVHKSFNEVIKVHARETIEPKEIQDQIAEKLNLNLTEKTVGVRALKLHKRVKDEKKILIVIDDLWKEIDLDEIGIPSAADHTGCKILITSRDSDIFNYMCTNKIFKINDLQEDEAWSLFKKFTGEIIETSDWKPLTVEIISKCARLPVVITTVAKALRKKPSSIWKDALDQLRKPVAVNIKGMKANVYSPLKLSYERLEDEEAKLLFVLCSMFPEDHSIDVEDLHVYAMGLDFLQDIGTVAQGRRRIIKLVDNLISSSLLLPLEYNHVKMHDIIRDVAISIASTHEHIRTLCYLNKELNNNEGEEEKIFGHQTAVYLNFGVGGPPQKLMLHKVQILELIGQRPNIAFNNVHELAETFFAETRELKVLKLKWFINSLVSLPLIYSFGNLRSLHLYCCPLENIDMIAELKNLEVLELGGLNWIQIPTAINQLTQLKVMNLSLCTSVEVISPNVLSRLTKLEELYLRTFKSWEGEELNEERKNASLSELKYLQRLSTLELWIPDEKLIPKQLFSREVNLDRFNISIGYEPEHWKYRPRFFRVLSLEMESGNCKDDDCIKMLSNKSEELRLIGSIGARVLGFELDENEASNVKHLYIENISEFQHLIHDEQTKPSRKALSNMRLLNLYNLENLESIVHGHVRDQPPLNKLRVVTVQKCDKLNSLFFNPILNDVLNLDKIDISDCEMLEVVMVLRNKEETQQTIEFTHLNYLELRKLPRLENFCFNIEELGQLVGTSNNFSHGGSFFSEKVSLPNLETLVIVQVKLKMICDNRLISDSFSKLKRLEIDSCKDLKYVFPSCIGNNLTCLESLEIMHCDLLEGIFEVQESRVKEEIVVSLPNLIGLRLYNLPNLEYLWSKEYSRELLTFGSMRNLSILRCPKFKGPNLVKVLEQCEESLMIDCSSLKEIHGEEKLVQELKLEQFEISKDHPELFSKLKSLQLCCHPPDYISTYLPMEIVGIFHKLESLDLVGILIEEIFPIKRSIDSLQVLNNLVPFSMSFRNLSKLTVIECHELTYLLNSSLATNLVHLNSLYIDDCKKMTTVFATGDEDGNDEIVFNHLSELHLFDLPNLTNFHSGKCIIRLLHLRMGSFVGCPKMKVFSLGTVTLSSSSTCTRDVGLCFRKGRFDIPKEFSKFEEDINVIARQAWEHLYAVDNQYISAQQNLEENKSDPSSSHVEEQE